tara:strand:- start:2010 stop:2372 length:363 start_codon:yes stop_codon:yes gene_type:complete
MLTYKKMLLAFVAFLVVFRKYKKRFRLDGIVQVHHIIPKQHKSHPTLKFAKYDVDDPKNLMFLPIHTSSLNTNRLLHDGGHIKYNAYVLSELKKPNVDPYTLCRQLKYRIRTADETLPWK